MMHRCSTSSHGNMAGACSCGMMYQQMVFSNGGHNHCNGYDGEKVDYYYYYTSSPSVDCTLSLGTPSTTHYYSSRNDEKKRSSGFGWNVLPSSTAPEHATAVKIHRGGGCGGDPLLARRCANCDTTSTPLWRNGPMGPKSLCNACGIRFKKEERMRANWSVPPQKTTCYSSSGNEYPFVKEHENHTNNYPFLS